jgi:hypothetical protein
VFGRNFSPISGLNVRCVATWFSSHVLPRYRSGPVSPYPATLSPFWFDRAYRPHASSDRAALACLAHTLGTDPVLNQVANRDRKPGAGVGDTVRATSPEMGCFAKADCVPYVATWFGSHVLPRYRSGPVSPYPATLSPFGFDRAYWPNASCGPCRADLSSRSFSEGGSLRGTSGRKRVTRLERATSSLARKCSTN